MFVMDKVRLTLLGAGLLCQLIAIFPALLDSDNFKERAPFLAAATGGAWCFWLLGAL